MVKIKCCICNKEFRKFTDKENRLIYEHDCQLYESIFQQKRIVRIELIE